MCFIGCVECNIDIGTLLIDTSFSIERATKCFYHYWKKMTILLSYCGMDCKKVTATLMVRLLYGEQLMN